MATEDDGLLADHALTGWISRSPVGSFEKLG